MFIGRCSVVLGTGTPLHRQISRSGMLTCESRHDPRPTASVRAVPPSSPRADAGDAPRDARTTPRPSARSTTGSSPAANASTVLRLWETRPRPPMQPVAACGARRTAPHEPRWHRPAHLPDAVEGTRPSMTRRGRRGRSATDRYARRKKNIFYFLTLLDGGRLQVMAPGLRCRDPYVDRHNRQHGSATPADSDEGPVWEGTAADVQQSASTATSASCRAGYNVESSPTARPERARLQREVCHGPGSELARLFREAAEKKKQPPPTAPHPDEGVTRAARNDTCAPCHAMLRPLTRLHPGSGSSTTRPGTSSIRFYPTAGTGETTMVLGDDESVCNRDGDLRLHPLPHLQRPLRFQARLEQACLP
jgi:hypothetical protein